MINQRIGHAAISGWKDGWNKSVIPVNQYIILIKCFHSADTKAESEVYAVSIIIYIGQSDISLNISMSGLSCIPYSVKTTFRTGDIAFWGTVKTEFFDAIIGVGYIQMYLPHLCFCIEYG